MEPLPTGSPRGTRLTLVALGIFALLVIVAFASRAGFGGGSQGGPSQTYLDYAFSAFLVLFVLAIPVTVWAYLQQQRENLPQERPRRRPFLQTMTLIGVFVAATLILQQLHRFHVANPFSRAKGASGRIGAGKKKLPVDQQIEPHFRWPVLVAFVVVLLALAVLFLVLRRRRARRVPLPHGKPEVRAELAAAISDAIGDLEAEPDARRAVIAAYARMEGVLSRSGLPRRPSETPFEYLARVLRDLRARPDSVRRLTTLFERAKFSRHEIDVGMKRDAIGALEALRDELQAAPA